MLSIGGERYADALIQLSIFAGHHAMNARRRSCAAAGSGRLTRVYLGAERRSTAKQRQENQYQAECRIAAAVVRHTPQV